MMLQLISGIIAHKQYLAHFVVWPGKVICIMTFVLLLYAYGVLEVIMLSFI